ncbi:MAG: ribonuclease III [Clostridia bacterium]|nr:ribonuclease III [Clostridia bacterium]
MEAGVTFRRGDYSPLVLAYLGDSFFETLAREYLVGDGNCKPSELNDRAREIVTAHSQSAMVDRLLPILTEDELAIYKSGRNSKSAHRSKSASALEYRRATGLECLYGYFWLTAQHARARELFLRCVQQL